ncbi:MAG: ferredoxin--NADP reductase [Candidatus Dormibacteraeota bacterium]|uniref:Ferredoxin--NADP reductase n=1 Tax=Candidatus Amunia macphersoniae TaxID=3127014 RepID=A0A934NF91_9BACT|nr:ferredoxin--NADP reductase [Candidatus Dormibacteraeota bacterium]
MFDTDKYATATIVSRRDLAADLWVVRIRPDVELPFRPGQYVTLGLELDGRIIERPYSIASDPAEPEIELFIERVAQGELSAPLHDVPIGSATLVRKRCKGLFLKDAPVPDHPLLLVCTVTGVAPFVSMVRSLRRRLEGGEWTAEHAVIVLQGAARSDELGYADELRRHQAECDWFTYVPTVSRPWEDTEWRGETGRVEDVLRKYADEAGLRPGYGAIFLCGNPGMIANSRGIMTRHGFADKAIREEQYWPD